MTRADILSVAEWYVKNIRGWNLEQRNEPWCLDLKYIRTMPVKMVDLADFPKLNRWLGFMQGVLWAHGIYSLDDLRTHNRIVTTSYE